MTWMIAMDMKTKVDQGRKGGEEREKWKKKCKVKVFIVTT